MKEPLTSYMKVGIVHFMAYSSTLKGEGPVLETVTKIVEDDFFSAIEVTWMKDDEVRKNVADVLRASHMTIGYGAQPPLLVGQLDLNSLNDVQRKKAVDQVKACVDEAYELGACRLAVLSGKDPGESDRQKATQLLIDSLKDIAGYARSKGDLALTLETFDRDIDKKCLIGPNSEAAIVAEEVKKEYPDFGLMVDLSHLPQQKESPEQALSVTKDHLVHVHIGNCLLGDTSHSAYGDKHPPFGIEGGCNDVDELAQFLKVLLDIGYLDSSKKELPVVAFEVAPTGGEKPEVIIANAKRTLIEAWAKL